jgi:hypothetical protein
MEQYLDILGRTSRLRVVPFANERFCKGEGLQVIRLEELEPPPEKTPDLFTGR